MTSKIRKSVHDNKTARFVQIVEITNFDQFQDLVMYMDVCGMYSSVVHLHKLDCTSYRTKNSSELGSTGIIAFLHFNQSHSFFKWILQKLLQSQNPDHISSI